MTAKPLLETVLGQAPAGEQAVTLDGIGPQAGEGAIAIELADPAGFDRLSYFATVLGTHPVPKHGVMNGQRVSGILFLSETPEDPDPWQHVSADLMHHAAHEIMEYHTRVPASDVRKRLPMILARAASRVAAQASEAPKLRSQTRQSEVTLHSAEATHEGFFLTRTFDLQHPRFDGTTSPRLTREVFVATDAVIVLPYDPVRDRVLLVEQFRMGPFARGDTFPWVLEPVAGRVDAGETNEDAARRECEEEAGLTLGALEHVSSHYCSPGASTEVFHCYVALADLPDEVAGLGGLATEHEDIRTHVLSFATAQDFLSSGEANIGPMILLLLWLERERSRLRASA